jgi:hypothetical protein
MRVSLLFITAVGACFIAFTALRVFHKLLYGQKSHQTQQYNATGEASNELTSEKPTTVRRSIFGRKESLFESAVGAVTTGSAASTGDDNKPSEKESRSLLRSGKSRKGKENKDTKLKLFLKRGSEPMLNGLPLHQQVSHY